MTPSDAALLIVDDDEDNRYTLSRRLVRDGYANIMTASNGREALHLLQSRAFDLMLLDIMMPEMNGYEVLEYVKGNTELRHLPVIMISALDEMDSIIRCIELGAEDYLAEPFNPTLLRARVRACLEKKRLRDELRASLEQLSEEKRAAESALAAAEAASLAKSRFLAAASHDLRQPLHALGLWCGLLRNSLTNQKAVERWEKMNLSVQSLDTLFSGLLDLSRFDAGSITPDIGKLSLQQILKRLDNDYRGDAQAKRIELRVTDTQLWVYSDPLWIERILRNLLANAIKYTHAGSVSLWCDEGAGAVRVVIRDTGIGISPADQQNIFEEYYQVDNPARHRDRGVGLGLAIVKRACNLLDHPISVHSELNVGSEFCVVLPRADPELPACAGEGSAEGDSTKFDGFVVVVIEDDDNIARAMTELLAECHCIPVVHEDADSAIAFLSAHRLKPQAIFADYRLRDSLTGIDAIETLRAKYGRVSAALVSGEVGVVDLQAECQLDYPVLRKPLDPVKIRRMLQAFQAAGRG